MMDGLNVQDGWADRTVHRLDEVDSTQNAARRLAEAGALEGTTVWAEHQTRGRGRLGRSWLAEPATALLLSVILRPASPSGALPASRLPEISLVAAVAVAEAIRETSGLPVTLSWPNDLLIHGRKAAGILAESFFPPAAAPVVILGIGLNVNQSRFPEELATRATSLALETGRQFDRRKLFEVLRDHLERWYRQWVMEGFAPVREAWRRGAGMLGERIADGRGGMGTAVDLGEDGALLVLTDAGEVVRRVAGDLMDGMTGTDVARGSQVERDSSGGGRAGPQPKAGECPGARPR